MKNTEDRSFAWDMVHIIYDVWQKHDVKLALDRSFGYKPDTGKVIENKGYLYDLKKSFEKLQLVFSRIKELKAQK